MPIAKVQLPDGRIAKFEVPEGTTPEQVVGFASGMDFGASKSQPAPEPAKEPAQTQQEKPSEKGFFRTLQNLGAVYPALETGAQLLTSSIATPVAGLAGLAALPFGGLSGATKTIGSVQNALTYKPVTERGKELSETAAIPFNALAKIGEEAGDVAYSATGSPTAGAITSSAFQAAPLLLGAKGVLAKKPAVASAIETGINKGIRPERSGKQTAGQRAAYMGRAKNAVETIAQNKENLVFKQSDGGVVAGELPKNLDEFSQAIAQTKKQIFDEYDSMARAADDHGKVDKYSPENIQAEVFEINKNIYNIAREKGVDPNELYISKGKYLKEIRALEADREAARLEATGVHPDKISPELKSIVSNKNLQSFSPETVQYAKSRAEALSGRGTMTLSETQDAIALLNQSLKDYYKNPNPATHGKAMVDELIANNLRKLQDEAITSTEGPGYQALKNKYGSLSTIEKEVNQRAVVDARKNAAGLVDFSNIFTAGQVIDGILTGSPSGVARGVVGQGVAGAIKYVNDPNRRIKTMFKKVDKARTAPSTRNALAAMPYMAATSQNALSEE